MRIYNELIEIDDHRYAVKQASPIHKDFGKWYAHAEFGDVDKGPYPTVEEALRVLGIETSVSPRPDRIVVSP